MIVKLYLFRFGYNIKTYLYIVHLTSPPCLMRLFIFSSTSNALYREKNFKEKLLNSFEMVDNVQNPIFSKKFFKKTLEICHTHKSQIPKATYCFWGK